MAAKKPYKTIVGVFYTDRDGPIEGQADSAGYKWTIVTSNGKKITRTDIYLDRGKRILAPKNPDTQSRGCEQVLKLIEKYEGEAKKLMDDPEALKISSYRLKLNMANIAVKEYTFLYMEYFVSNSAKYILSLGF